LGLAGILGETVIATEAGHINISDKELRPDLKEITDRFSKENYRAPTYEDFLSGKGITYFYETLSGKTNLELSSEKILLARGDKYSLQTIELLNYLLSSYLRYMALAWGSYGGVLLSGSIVNSLLLEENYQEFRNTFENSETMKDFMRTIPLAIVLIDEIGFVGGLELSKKLK
jgi:Glucokinase